MMEERQHYFYRFVFDHGPGHQSHTETRRYYDHEPTPDELRDEWESIYEAHNMHGAVGTCYREETGG